jgi:hypothetical protein
MKKAQVIIEKSKTGFAAYLPGLPGCVSTGVSLKLFSTIMTIFSHGERYRTSPESMKAC